MQTGLPDPVTAPELFDSVLSRRVLAYFIDLAIIGAILLAVLVLSLISGFLTFGLAWIAYPITAVIGVMAYYAATLGSSHRATVGMAVMDLVLTPTRGAPLEGWRAFAHPLLFWITCWFLPPLSYVFALFTPRRQMLHDLVLGTLMVRRSPMERHWSAFPAV